MNTPFHQRRRSLKANLLEAKIDALLVTSHANWYYLAGFSGESGALVMSRKATSLIIDGRFTVQARVETSEVSLVPQKGSLFESVGMAETLRMRKDAAELAQMRRAALLADEVVQWAIGLLKPGIREFEVGAEIEYQMRRKGASGPAFETIVAFGERAALPHARPTGKRLRKNELVVLDLGVILGHYCSDITRTVFVGRATRRIRTWYQAVLEAQTAAIAAAKSGATCGDVDGAARQVLTRYHLDHLFVHSTGHGLGLEVHEDPRVARGQKKRLEPGNVITIEPGVYSAGIGGIRIEDDVAVHADRTEVLTRAPRDLIEI